MSKRKEKFCDMRVEGPTRPLVIDERGHATAHPLVIDGRCVEPAEGTCSRCQGDYCHYHAGGAYIELHIHFATKAWPIPLCKACSEAYYEHKGKPPLQLETGFERLSQETAQWLGKRGPYAPKEKPKLPEPELARSPEEKLLFAIFGETNFKALVEFNGVELRTAIEAACSGLSERDLKVLRLRFGFDDPDGRGLTYQEIGKQFDVTRERIRQIENKALRWLRHPSRSRELKDYLGDPALPVPMGDPVPNNLTVLMPIEGLGLSIRVQLCLKRGGINTVEDILLSADKLMRLRNFGLTAWHEVEAALAKAGLELKRAG